MQKFYIHGFRKNRELFLIKYIIKYRTKFVNGKCVGLGEIFGKEKGWRRTRIVIFSYPIAFVAVL